MQDRIQLVIENNIAHVTLNRPEVHNALDLKMFHALADTQKKLSRKRRLRAVILTGAGVDFCSGLDVKSIMKDRSAMLKLLWKWLPWRANLAQVVSVGWRRMQVPIIAAIHGRCWGGGLQIALGADFRLVTPDASLSVMESRWGLIPDMGGNLALRELVGRDQAMWLAMSADTFDGSEAVKLGVATRVVPDPEAAARSMAAALSQRSPDAVAAVKRLYRKSWHGSPGAMLSRETAYQIRVIASDNQRIAVARQRGKEKEFRSSGRW